jgi:hypothetical protein
MGANMAKMSKTQAELEAILLSELRGAEHCEGATMVSIYRLSDKKGDANWTVANFNPGTSGTESCQQALIEIERRLQRLYDLAPES